MRKPKRQGKVSEDWNEIIWMFFYFQFFGIIRLIWMHLKIGSGMIWMQTSQVLIFSSGFFEETRVGFEQTAVQKPRGGDPTEMGDSPVMNFNSESTKTWGRFECWVSVLGSTVGVVSGQPTKTN